MEMVVPALIWAAIFGFLAILAEILRKLLEINFVAWSLRRQGVSAEDIRKFALVTAKRQHRNMLVMVLDKVLNFIKFWKR